MRSKSGQPLERYFPDLMRCFAALPPSRMVLDGEIVIPIGDSTSFEELQMRLHPAASRGGDAGRRASGPADRLRLARRCRWPRPAGIATAGTARGAAESRRRLRPNGRIVRTNCRPRGGRGLATAGHTRARRRHGQAVGRRLCGPGRGTRCSRSSSPGLPIAWLGGFRFLKDGSGAGSLLLGLYNDDGLLDHVGFTSNIPRADRAAWTMRLEALRGPPGFTGKAPGGPSRWNKGEASAWESLRPELVVEVGFDHVTGLRFRHGTSLLRVRPDKAARQCRLEQIT